MSEDDQEPPDEMPDEPPAALGRNIGVALAIALGMGLGVYALASTASSAGVISIAFLLVLPGAISAIVCFVIDPRGKRSGATYLMVPVWILLGVIVVSLVLLREGVVCILMLAPLWLVSGMAGSGLTYALRNRPRDGRKYCSALLVAPLLVMQVEPSIPVPQAHATVSRSIIVAASPEQIWPLLRGIPDVKKGEGRWNLSQDVIGIPRPRGAQLVGEGIGAERLADWGHDIRFRERITQWEVNKRIGWAFIFDDIEGWKFTDRHLVPDGAYLRVSDGAYSLERIDAQHTRVTIDTRYWMKTPVNAYSALWGEFFLGDLENNLLALVKARAEAKARAI